ncbi:MAG: M48 family metallopeptidase [Bacillota bacterium]|nr:M48 family metallopeptidase [Bacillota bacterium]HHT90476.1 M48 family metallopeptidase [Bacillota bacterium]
MTRIRSRKPGFILLIMLAASFLSYTVYAAPTYSFGERFERTLGGGTAPELVKQYGGEYILPFGERMWVEEVFRRLVGAVERHDIDYTLTVLNTSEWNAFALPGGYVFITRGLVQAIGDDEAKLSAVLSHEIAHIEKRHGMQAVLRQMGLTVLFEVGAIALDVASADLMRLASTTLLQLINLGWGREAEFEADRVGQALAVKAGFDGVGPVTLLDDLLRRDSNDQSLKVFRTHPETKQRRDRLAANLVSYWSAPLEIMDQEVVESLYARRNSDQMRRTDPNGRYLLTVDARSTGLTVLDQQLGHSFTWLGGTDVLDFAWSPQGQYLAVMVDDQAQQGIWICDRWGHGFKMITLAGQSITGFSWSPQSDMLALNLEGSAGPQVVVTYVDAEVFVPVSREFAAMDSIWLEDGLYLLHGDRWYQTVAPRVQEVIVPNPVPRVLQRQRILSPTVIKEGNTIRLTRPSLTMP